MQCAIAVLCCLAAAFAGQVEALRGASGGKSNVEDVSACQRCADGGDCSLAFRGQPGQFCGSWVDRGGTRRPCCCPIGSVCRVSTYDCRCSAGGYPSSGRAAVSSLVWVWWLLGAILLCVCCGPCCVIALHRYVRRRRERDQIPEAIPVDGGAPYYSGNSVAGLPAVGPQTYPSGSGWGGRAGGMGAGTGAALGGTAGLLGGLLLGNALADGPNYGDGGFGGGVDGGVGGGDFSGDF